jgi:hypothetical protein
MGCANFMQDLTLLTSAAAVRIIRSHESFPSLCGDRRRCQVPIAISVASRYRLVLCPALERDPLVDNSGFHVFHLDFVGFEARKLLQFRLSEEQSPTGQECSTP